MRAFSVVVPIHNEIQYLPGFMDSLRDLTPDETIFILDRCTDGSYDYVSKRSKNLPFTETQILRVSEEDGTNWHRRVGYLRRLGYYLAKNEIILTCDADMILDPNIAKYSKVLDDQTKYVGFGYFDKPLNIKSILRNLYPVILPIDPYSGLYMFSRQAWLETEDLEEARQMGAEDAHLKLAIESKYKTKHYITKTRHLRSNETIEHDKMRGKNYALTVNAPLWKVTLMSLAMLRPYMLLEYLKTKRVFSH
jgi:glycosyltransferase involved in cell wall biosynthesis